MKIIKRVKVNKDFINIFKGIVLKTSARHMHKIADDFVRKVREVIYRQLYTWPPLSPAYVLQKKRKHLDPRILIATKKYVKSIKAIRSKTRKDGVIYSAGPTGYTEKGLPMTLLGKYLEFGTSKMKMREHWRPAWSAFLRRVPYTKKELKKGILRDFSKVMKSRNKIKIDRSN